MQWRAAEKQPFPEEPEGGEGGEGGEGAGEGGEGAAAVEGGEEGAAAAGEGGEGEAAAAGDGAEGDAAAGGAGAGKKKKEKKIYGPADTKAMVDSFVEKLQEDEKLAGFLLKEVPVPIQEPAPAEEGEGA